MRCLVALLLTVPALAQPGTPSPPAGPTPLDSLRRGLAGLGNAVWLTGENAAGLRQWQSFGYGTTQLAGHQTTGAFRRPQEPLRHTELALRSEGLRLVNGWAVFGAFAYRKTVDQRIAFSHGYDPFNGNPYLWADTLAGNWQRDHIRARVAVASPRLGRIRLGLSLPYHVGQGARLLDPKPFYRFRELGVLPSVWYDASPRWQWGLVLGGRFTQEENEVGFFVVQPDFPLLYRLRGYGSFSRTPIVTAERRITGSVGQLTLQSVYRTGNGSWLAQVGGQWRRETILEGIASPEPGGLFTETTADALLARVRQRGAGGSRLALHTQARLGRGIDPILRATGATYTLTTTHLSATRWQQAPERFAQQTARLTAETLAYSDQITRTDWSAVRLTGYLDVRHRWERANGRAWYAHAGLGLRYVPARSLVALRPTTLTDQLVRPDYHIQTQNALLGSLAVGREFRFDRTGDLLHRLEARLDGQFTDQTGHRLTAGLTYSLVYR